MFSFIGIQLILYELVTLVRIDTEDLSITPIAKISEEECAGQHEDFKYASDIYNLHM